MNCLLTLPKAKLWMWYRPQPGKPKAAVMMQKLGRISYHIFTRNRTKYTPTTSLHRMTVSFILPVKNLNNSLQCDQPDYTGMFLLGCKQHKFMLLTNGLLIVFFFSTTIFDKYDFSLKKSISHSEKKCVYRVLGTY